MKKQTIILIGCIMGAILLTSPRESNACKKVKQENAELRDELEVSRLRNAELEAQLQEQQNELEMRNQEMLEMKTQLDLYAQEILEMQNQIDVKNSELQQLYDEVGVLEKNVQELGEMLKVRGDELSSQVALLTQKKQGLEDQVIALKADINAAAKRNERLGQLVDDYEKKINTQSVEIKNLKTERDKLQKIANDLSNSLKAKTDELSKQVGTLTTQKQNLEKQFAELRKDIDTKLAAEAADKERMKVTYDQLLKNFEKEIGQQTVEIQHYKDALTINIMDKIFFDSGKAEIKPEGFDVLRRVGAILKNVPDKMIRIEGHTDDIPIGQKIIEKYPTNWELGAARASKVAEFFRKDVGIDPKRISVVSYSMYRPLVPHTTKVNRAKNRRIEIVVLDKLHYQMMEVKESMEQ